MIEPLASHRWQNLNIHATGCPAPIIVFGYNRAQKLRLCLKALAKNNLAKESELYIFVDGPKPGEAVGSVLETREVAKAADGFARVHREFRDQNMGLANSIVTGVTSVIEKHGAVIVVEDDIIVASSFLEYMNDGLSVYAGSENVGCVSGYTYPIDIEAPETFFVRGAECWGWATWADKWALFEPNGQRLLRELKDRGLVQHFDCNNSFPYTRMLQQQVLGKIDSWAIRWHASLFLSDQYTLFPKNSLVENVGFDDSGTHGVTTDVYKSTLTHQPVSVERLVPETNSDISNALARYFKRNRHEMIFRKLKNLLFKGLLAGVRRFK